MPETFKKTYLIHLQFSKNSDVRKVNGIVQICRAQPGNGRIAFMLR